MYQVENPVVIDSLWKGFVDIGKDAEEEYIETRKVNIEVDVSRLTDDEIDELCGELEDVKESVEYDEKADLKIDIDLPINFNAEYKNYRLEINGKCSERIYLDMLDVLDCCKNITYTERRI